MNPLRGISAMQRVMSLKQQVASLQQNPGQIGKMLLDSGKISEEHYKAIKDMRSPSQIGNYLMQNGVLNQQQIDQLSAMMPRM